MEKYNFDKLLSRRTWNEGICKVLSLKVWSTEHVLKLSTTGQVSASGDIII